jgi:hypothetical protein
VLLDRYLVDGGHTPPAGFDVGQTNVQCPGPPAKVPPPEPEPKKPKKKRKKLEDTKVPEVPEQPETPSAPKKPGG